ncbi:MAG: hypothetical protein QOD90_2638 [Mycobacterium sp.]|jgi:hypothetical protein|nr:hypothetical protein [Mycobacterium sp.]
MSQHLHSLWRTRLMLVIVAVAAVGLLAACSGTPERSVPAPASGGIAEGVGAPAPQNGPPPDLTSKRDVVKTASMTIDVASTSEAADKAAVVVERADGRVDSRSEDAGSRSGRAQTSMVLRVPAAKLDGVVRELKTLGALQTAETTAEDVTAQRIDLDARIKALQTSVDRLLAIMRDAKDPDALIKAEDALSQRQADLDSLRAQRDQLGDRIDYSTVSVTFLADQPGGPAPKRYDGFVGQIERGWDALVSVVGNAVLLFGLLLPWLSVVAVMGVIGYVLIRLVRRTR